ncbi:hypothetical protein RFI_33881, partial [Reticulomyxa filosa]
FRVSISLTPEGLKNWEYVVEIVYRYIAKMKELKDERWAEYWDERKKVKAMNFAFKSKESPYDYATNLAQCAHQYPLDHLLECINGLFFKCDTVICRFQIKLYFVCMYDQIVKHFFFFFLYCFVKWLEIGEAFLKVFEHRQLLGSIKCKETEKWYGTSYQRISLTSEQLKRWKELEPNKYSELLFTPPPNPYIADDFSLFCEKSNNKQTTQTTKTEPLDEKEFNENWLGEPPQIIFSTDQMRLWFKMDEYFKQPKLGVKFKIISPHAANSCANQMLTTLLFLCFQDVMSELTYTFTEASLSSYAAFDNVSGINVDFFGYNQKLPALVETVLSKLGNFELSE